MTRIKNTVRPELSRRMNHIINVSLTRDCFNVGSRTDRRDTFLCAGKEKYPKETRRMPLASCALAVLSGVAGRDFLSLQQRVTSLPHPFGLFPTKPPVLGAAYGIK
jgi:hypothetical protein